MKTVVKGIFLVILSGILGMTCLVGAMFWSVIPRPYITTDIADYGQYTGNNDNESAQEFITSFFPEKISDEMQEVQYSYRAMKNDAYAYEAVLEFVIEDAQAYTQFVESYTDGLTAEEFRYDPAYTQYEIADRYELASTKEEAGERPAADVGIRYARIGKILCNPEQQRIVFVAMGVYDGGYVKTEFLSAFFNRFGINDPWEYEEACSNE